MSAFNYFTNCITQKFADFNGRARRSEYWYFTLFAIIAYVVASIVDSLIGMPILFGITALGLLVPSLAVGVRRLHDTNRSGWWMLLAIVPLVSLVLLVFMIMDGTPGSNEYGANPKGIGSDEPIEHLIDSEV